MSLHFTSHGEQRRVEMDVPVDEVELTVTEPELTYPTKGRVMFQRGRLAVLVKPPNHVVTVLWRKTEQWSRTSGHTVHDAV